MRKAAIQPITLLIIALAGVAAGQSITVRMASPVKNGRYPLCQDVLLAAEVTATGSVKQVEFYVNGSRFKTVTKAPYETVIPSAREGMYEIYARGVAQDGSSATTEPYYIYVGNIEPGNVIINGDFNCGLTPWFLDNYVNAHSKVTVVPDLSLTNDLPGVIVEIENQGDQFWAIQLMQPFKIKAGHSYEITFWAQADAPKDIYVDINKNYGDYSQLYSKKVTVDQLDLYGPYTFDAGVDDDNLMFKFVLGGNTTTFYLDGVKVIDKQWTGVEAAYEPAAFSLFTNYPNPFNASTTIVYELNNNGPVELEIFDILGKRVFRRAAVEAAGRHFLNWNGLDESGRPCPSGLYLCRLCSIDGSSTRKMSLLR